MALLEVVDPEKVLVLRHDPWPVVSLEDCAWLIELFGAAKSDSRKRLLARLIAATVDRDDNALFERLYALVMMEPSLRTELLAWFGPIELESDLADALRANLEHEQAMTARRREQEARRANQQPRDEYIDALLDRVEAGEVEIWWRINLALGFNEEQVEEVDEHHGQVTETPGWEGADPGRQRRLVAAALRYLREADPHTGDWLNDHRLHTDGRPMAAYRAFRLLVSQDPVFFEGLARNDWERWAPAILYFLERGSDDLEVRQALFRHCYRDATDTVVDLLSQTLDRAEAANGGHLPLLEEVGGSFDSRLGGLLWERTQRLASDASARPSLLGFLLEHGYTPARRWAEAQVGSKGHQPRLAEDVLAAGLLLRHARDCGWELLWPVFQARPEFGQAAWLELADRHLHGDLGNLLELPPIALAELFLWFERSMPWNELPDRPNGEAFTPTPLENLDTFRRRLFNFLVETGTRDACEGVRKIVEGWARPDEIRWKLREAEQNLRQKTFPWPTPTEVLRLLDQAPRARLVRTEAELLGVIVEALGRLQVELLGETPAVADLWNIGTSCCPKDEAALCDYIKRFLDRDLAKSGVIVNREVVICRKVGEGGASGERTDIHVNVRVPGTGDKLTVIIEVKGCWNAGLMTDMDAQLVDRYLHANQCRHGLYLVGWFDCPQWQPRSSHRHAQSLPQLAAELEEQSRLLSTAHGLTVSSLVLDAALR